MKRGCTSTDVEPASKKQCAAHHTLDVKASVIQRAWRKLFQPRTLRRCMEAYKATDARSDLLRPLPFDILLETVKRGTVMDAVRGVLTRFYSLSLIQHGIPSDASDRTDLCRVRMFLSSYLILFHANKVFEQFGVHERELIAASEAMITSFDRIIQAAERTRDVVPSQIQKEVTEGFAERVLEYYRAFKTWKKPDERKLVARAKHALIAIFDSLLYVNSSSRENAAIIASFNEHRDQLEGKIRAIVGPKECKRIIEECRKASELAHAASHARSLGHSSDCDDRLTNEELAHQLLLDPAYKMTHSDTNANSVRGAFNRAFWDSVLEDMKLEYPVTARVLRLCIEARDGLRVTAPFSQMDAIHETLDVDTLREKLEKDAYTLEEARDFIDRVVAIVVASQLRSREADMKEKWAAKRTQLHESSDKHFVIVRGLEFIIERVNLLRLDAANIRLQLVAPVVSEYGVDYLRNKFNEKLFAMTITLERTQV